MTVRSVLREPLLHFLLLGLGLFGLHAAVAPADRDGRRIDIDAAQLSGIDRQFRATWSRPPTAAELSALAEQRIRDEIVYREGRAMGLDRDDAMIKRRVRQKYDLISEDENGRAATDAELDAYRRAHPQLFMQPGVVTFDQSFFGNNTAAAASAAGRGDPGPGQPSLLPRHVETTPVDAVARDFGSAFAARLAGLPVGRWIGPVASGYGLHLVRVSSRSGRVLPPLAAVRGDVEREWENDRRLKAREADYARLRQEYVVTVAGHSPTGSGG